MIPAVSSAIEDTPNRGYGGGTYANSSVKSTRASSCSTRGSMASSYNLAIVKAGPGLPLSPVQRVVICSYIDYFPQAVQNPEQLNCERKATADSNSSRNREVCFYDGYILATGLTPAELV